MDDVNIYKHLIMLYISDVMNMVGMIEFRIFSTACVMSIIGYHYALGNFIFGTER